nr:hypothetical protein CFP56_07881 [Quercus suber]
MDEGYESSTVSPITPQYPPVLRQPEVLPSPSHTFARRDMLPTPPPSPPRTHPHFMLAVGSRAAPVHDAHDEADDESTTPTSQTALHSGQPFYPAVDHPDLGTASFESFQQQKRQTATPQQQQPDTVRSARHRHSGKRGLERHRAQRKRRARMLASQRCLCIIAGLLLAAVVATYLSLAIAASSPLTATFHILFILGVLFATIIFAHTLARLCLIHRGMAGSTQFLLVRQHGKNNATVKTKARSGKIQSSHHHHDMRSRRGPPQQRQGRGARVRDQESNGDEIMAESAGIGRQLRVSRDFLPPTPIQVHVASDDMPPRESSSGHVVIERQAPVHNAWDRPVEGLANPPPAYGRWRGSVRANPDLLHWQPIPSPVSPESEHVLPSPTYEEVIAADKSNASEVRTGPPSYATRDVNGTPMRVRTEVLAQAQIESRKPEMIEIAGVGMAAEPLYGLHGRSPILLVHRSDLVQIIASPAALPALPANPSSPPSSSPYPTTRAKTPRPFSASPLFLRARAVVRPWSRTIPRVPHRALPALRISSCTYSSHAAANGT